MKIKPFIFIISYLAFFIYSSGQEVNDTTIINVVNPVITQDVIDIENAPKNQEFIGEQLYYADADSIERAPILGGSTNLVDMTAYFKSPVFITGEFTHKGTSIFISADKTEVNKILRSPLSVKAYSLKDSFIEDAETGEKFYILSSSIGFKDMDENIALVEGIEQSITEKYPNLPNNVKVVNIGFGDNYYVKNLRIRN